ncbi:hypothetical protein V9T40_009208 [Parthenolecanium corni]|uniref:Uncharacterized protein n=1 Tax=Parthenolecanium corni TaxID=536013 RepID=A0AAN9TQ13_9HEMI
MTAAAVYTYDLNYNNNSNDWLNAGCSKYVGPSANSHNASAAMHNWSQSSVYLQQATVVDAPWSFSNHNF